MGDNMGWIIVILLILLAIIVRNLINKIGKKIGILNKMNNIPDKNIRIISLFVSLALLCLIVFIYDTFKLSEIDIFMYVFLGLFIFTILISNRVARFIVGYDNKDNDKYLEKEEVVKNSSELSLGAKFLAIFLGIVEGLDNGKK